MLDGTSLKKLRRQIAGHYIVHICIQSDFSGLKSCSIGNKDCDQSP